MTGSTPSEFMLTDEHLTLLRLMYVEDYHSDCETGAPWIDPKRPYGNSDVAGDVVENLGWGSPTDDRDDWSDDLLDRAMALHRQTQFALQIVLFTGEFRTGLYRRPISYDTRTWVRVGDVS